ncbi:MAG: cysteine desulfurase family protein [Eubacteriales bacterium]
MIYADNAATTKLCAEAYEAMKPYLQGEYGNASQPYSFAKSVKDALKSARETIATYIGAAPEEIIFTSGGTESDNWVIKSNLFSSKDKNGIVTSEIEHHAILNSCKTMEELGVPVKYVSVDNDGIINEAEFADKLSQDVRLASVMFANNEIGTIEPVKHLAVIAHEHGALFHSDAVQAVGHIPIDVHALGIDMLSSSAHKFNGPKGIGFLYLRRGLTLHNLMDGGSQEKGCRAGTENVASIVGMAAALKKNISQMESTITHLRKIEGRFVSELRMAGLSFIRNGADDHLPGNVNISFKNTEGEMLLHRLDLRGICVSTGSACDSVNTQVSHVIKAIKVPAEYAEGTIRVTFGPDNTEEDARQIATAIKKILQR